jgi:hypothetical protein
VGWVAMSERDVQRIRVLSEVLSGRRTVRSAAAVLEMTPRQARRLLGRLRDGGGGAIGHRLRGRPPNRRIEPGIVPYAMDLVRERYRRRLCASGILVPAEPFRPPLPLLQTGATTRVTPTWTLCDVGRDLKCVSRC